jgi:hypothetical protein
MSAPNWATGMRQLTPGIYVDRAGAIHFDLVKMCEDLKVAPTPGNQEIIQRAAERAVRDMGILPQIETFDEQKDKTWKRRKEPKQ